MMRHRPHTRPKPAPLCPLAGIYWISTVRPNGAPQVTPLVGLWHDGAAWFCTGAAEQAPGTRALGVRVLS